MYRSLPSNFPWPVLLALALGVIVPTVFILWTMLEAMGNERLAAYQKISEVYRHQLLNFSKVWEAQWKTRLTDLDKLDKNQPSSILFASISEQRLASSAIIHAHEYQPGYPRPIISNADSAKVKAWETARELEFVQGNCVEAISHYRRFVESGSSDTTIARAYQAWSRCLIKMGKVSEAITLLKENLGEARFKGATNVQGRIIQINSQLRLLQLLSEDEASASFRKEVERKLLARINDYGDTSVPAEQRLFIMRKFPEQHRSFVTLEAEHLAARYLEVIPNGYLERAPGGDYPQNLLVPTEIPNVWQVSKEHLTALYTETFLEAEVEKLAQQFALAKGVSVQLLPPLAAYAQESMEIAPSGSILVGDVMPGWRLNLVILDEAFIETEASAQVAAYLWTAVLFILVILVMGMVVAWYVYKQVKLHQLKNSLIDTVSHELKTPLAGIRLLVETLINSEEQFSPRTSDYLGLIDKENKRLTRLIDNFLTFSRMEHNRHVFDFEQVVPKEILLSALEPYREKLEVEQFKVEVDIPESLPDIEADFSMMVTVLTNLIENAYKYSGHRKYIKLRIYQTEHNINFEISDKGVGLSVQDSKKIFDRFYRVDQAVARQTEGCGLGLSIVKYIVEHHHGQVSVSGKLGEGSVFTVSIPIEMPE